MWLCGLGSSNLWKTTESLRSRCSELMVRVCLLCIYYVCLYVVCMSVCICDVCPCVCVYVACIHLCFVCVCVCVERLSERLLCAYVFKFLAASMSVCVIDPSHLCIIIHVIDGVVEGRLSFTVRPDTWQCVLRNAHVYRCVTCALTVSCVVLVCSANMCIETILCCV